MEEQRESQRWDLIIVGAGIYGIQVARTYLELHPTRRVLVLEASSVIGGVWSRERIYDDFWTQTPLGLLEFSDRRMHPIPDDEQYYGFFKAHHVASYLEEYCESQHYDGASLRSRIRVHEPVVRLRKADDLWHVETRSGAVHQSPRIVDASGLTSAPKFPDLPGRDTFRGSVVHHKEWAKLEGQLKNGPKADVTVMGGAKSAADVVYSLAKSGHSVTWLIRRSGSGPAAFVSAQGRMGYANSNESFYTRLTSLFLVSLFSLGMRYAWLVDRINRSRVGRRVLQRAWHGINAKAVREADYDRADGKANGFPNLRPDTELFWQNDSTGINQRPDFFDVIVQRVKVVREDISHLCESGIVLRDGETLDVDVIICATGWSVQHPYLDERTAAALGLSVPGEVLTTKEKEHWKALDAQADKYIIETFPILDGDWARANDGTRPGTEGQEPFRLWKSIVPLHDQSILFVGELMLGNHFRAAEVQALFACAMLDGAVILPSLDEREQDVSKTIAWCRRRYLKKGELGNWFY